MRIIITFACVCFSLVMMAQTSDISKGCIPLVVNFEAPSSSSYYWDFGDGGDSQIMNPEHIYTSDGVFTVSLYKDASKAELIGSLDITVYPDLIVEIDADQKEGCVPREINFTSDVTRHPDVIIEGYLWTFGNGARSIEKDPSYKYEQAGLYDVSLEVTTNLPECDKTIIVEDMIDLFAYVAEIDSDKNHSCEYPATFNLMNLSQQDPALSYEWSLNNEVFSNDFEIGPLTLEEPGTYVVVFRMTTSEGCMASDIQTFLVGAPVIDLNIDEVSCPDSPITLINNSSGARHVWDFGEGAEPQTSTEENPSVTYTTTGPKTISYSNRQGLCQTDTIIEILITDDFATFTVTPETICGDSIIYTLTADYNINGAYCWNGETTPGEQVHYVTRVNEETDPEHINEVETIEFQLEIKADNGCVATYSYSFEAQLPEAFFIPDSVIGVAPLTIGFEDRSSSSEAIVSRIWKFGDGTVLPVDTNITYVTHTFLEPGEHCVQLCIEDEAGCTDVSKETCITVLDPNDTPVSTGEGSDVEIELDGSGGGSGSDPIVCVGEEYNIRIRSMRPNLEQIITTDDSRFNLCWRDSVQKHTFRYPGEFPIISILEKDGYELTRDSITTMTVLGARSEIEYKMDCSSKQEVFLKSNSINAQRLQWYHNGNEISTQDSLVHNLVDPGAHEIVLEAINDDDGCTPHTDTVIVYVAEPISAFTVEEILCDNVPYMLDATTSSGAKEPCSNSYRWDFEFQRPRAVSDSLLSHVFVNGRQDVTLTVTDINGCTDSATKSIAVYGTQIDYGFPELICLPHEQAFENNTTSDTTIVSWEWNFGSSEISPERTFTEEDLTIIQEDTINILLTTEDALGCRDSLMTTALIFDPESEIIIPDLLICEGAPIEISAADYTEHNTQLLFDWDFASGGTSMERENEVSFQSDGLQTIQLIIRPEGLSCVDTLTAMVDVLPAPNADFITSVDSLETICYPHTIEFTNTSVETGSTAYLWDLGNGSTSILENPASSFDRGTYTIRLIATSSIGCMGVQEKTFDIVGPDGEIVIDKDQICLGEDITAQLINQTDLSEWQWDMGDGTVYQDQETVMHTYTFVPPDNENKIEVILKSTATGCEVVKSVPLNINEVIADFELETGLNYCEGLARFENLSIGGSEYLWDFGTEQSTESDPSLIFDDNGDKLVTLTVTDPLSGCVSTISKQVTIDGEDAGVYEFPNVFTPNSDGRNDLFRAIIPAGLEDVIKVTDFKVFDKWGQLLFDNDSPEGWDGTFSGDQMPSDVYAYYIEIDVEDCKVVNDKGNVTLIR